MKPHRFALENPYAVLVGALLVTLLGLRAFFTMPTEYFPDTSPPQVVVVTVEPGAAAVDVGRRITEVIEKELAGIDKLKRLTSSSRDEVSAVNAEFLYDKPIGEAVVDVQNAISRIRADLPSDILEPRIYRVTDAIRPIVTLSLTPKPGSPLTLSQIRLLADNDIKDYLLDLPGIADVDTFGGNRMQVNVWLDRDRLRAYGLTSKDVARAVQAQNITTPAGLMEGPQGEALVKTLGEFKDLQDIRDLVLRQTRQGYLLLKDVARVELGTEDERSLYHGNGKRAIAVNVLRPDGGSVINAIRTLKNALPQMEAMWPDIRFEITNDQQPLIDRNTSGMRSSLYLAMSLTIFIIFAFLADIRSSAIALVSIPLSFLFGVAVLSFTGYTLNIVTLSGLIIATGMVVDATVVVVENIHRHRKFCTDDPRKCVEGAVTEIYTSIAAGMSTTVIMIVPIMFAGGYVEKVLRQFTVTLSLALLGSFLVAVFVVPPLALRLIRPEERKKNLVERSVSWVDRLVSRLAEAYVRLLRRALRHRLLALGIALGLLVFSIRLVMPIIGRQLMPPMDTGIANVAFELPPTASIEDMDRTLSRVERILKKEPGVLTISSVVGSEPGQISFGSGGQTAQKAFITVNLTTRDRRDRSIWEIQREWREEILKVPGLRSLQIHEFGATPMSTSRAPIDLMLMGRDPHVLARLGRKIRKRLEGVPGLADVTFTWWGDKQEVDVRVDPRMARLYGTNPQNVAEQLRIAVGGIPVSGFRLSGFLDVPIRVAYDDAWVATRERLADVDISTPKGVVPLRTLAVLENHGSQTVITRENLQNILDLTGYNDTLPLSQVVEGIARRLKGFRFPGGYGMKFSGSVAEMKDSMKRVARAVMLGMLLLVVLLVGVFQSVVLPLPILVAIPLAVIGSLWGLLLFHKPMCMPAMMGMLLLAGVVINNSIFLIDFIKQALATGMKREDAVEQSVRLRLRPILMTTISTVVGMMPLIFEMAVGLERMSPLGTAAAFGLMAGTVMTLVITPVTYTLLDDAGRWLRR